MSCLTHSISSPTDSDILSTVSSVIAPFVPIMAMPSGSARMGSFWVVIGLECPSSLDNFAYRTAASSSTRPGDAEPRSGVHQLPELVEQISAPVSGLDLVLHRVR